MMKTLLKPFTTMALTLGTVFAYNTASAAPAENDKARLLVRKMFMGDAMGSVSDQKPTKMTKYFYNADNTVISEIDYNSPAGDDNWEVSYIYRFEFDANGNPTSKTQKQKQKYLDYGDEGFTTKTLSTWEYNDAGQLVSETDQTYKYVYEYDADGNVAKMTKGMKSTGKVSLVEEYLNYESAGCPAIVVSSSEAYPTNSQYNYVKINNYEEGRKLNSATYQKATLESLDNIMLSGTLPNILEQWTYDEDGNPVLYIKCNNKWTEEGQPLWTNKTVYTLVDGNSDKIRERSYTCSNGTADLEGDDWKGSGLPVVNEYETFDNNIVMAMSTMLLAEKAEEALNTVKLSWAVPAEMMISGGNFDIYRNGEVIKSGNMTTFYNAETGVCSYTDPELANGLYQYFIQPMKKVNKGMETEEEFELIGYNTSNLVSIELDLPLEAVRNLHATGKGTELFKDPETGATGEIEVAYLKWDNPEGYDKYGFINNSVYINNKYTTAISANNTTEEIDATTMFLNPSKDEVEIFIITRYKYGKAFSDHITINMNELNTTNVSNANAGNKAVCLQGKKVMLDETADISVFNMAGVRIISAKAKEIDLGSVANGAYIMTVERNGKVNAYKMVLK